MIPGIDMTGMMDAAGPEITFVASATSSANSVTIPASAQAGDLAVMFSFAAGMGAPVAVPSGWASIGTLLAPDAFSKHQACRKTLGVSDPGASVSPISSGSSPSNIVLVFRLGAGWGATESNNQQATASGSTSNQTITSGPAPYIALAAYRTNFDGTPGFSPAQDGTVALSNHTARYKIFNADPQAVTASFAGGEGSTKFLRSFRIGMA